MEDWPSSALGHPLTLTTLQPLTSNDLAFPDDTTLELTVERADPERLDRWLTANIKELSRNRIQKLIDWEYVSLNGQRCTNKKASVQVGDRIQVTVPAPKPLELIPEDIPLDILYEDEHLIILNKPAGLVVHPAPGNMSGTLVNAILAHCGEQLLGIGGVQRPGIVHRLDKDTTGAIVVAKTDLAHSHLQAQMKAKTARREYLGVVYGAPKTESGTIDLPLGRHPNDRKKNAVVPLEKEAATPSPTGRSKNAWATSPCCAFA